MNKVDITRKMQSLLSAQFHFVQTFSVPGVSTCKINPGSAWLHPPRNCGGCPPRSLPQCCGVDRSENNSRWFDTENRPQEMRPRTGLQRRIPSPVSSSHFRVAIVRARQGTAGLPLEENCQQMQLTEAQNTVLSSLVLSRFCEHY